MNSRVQIYIQVFEPGAGWVHYKSLLLDDEQQAIVSDWLAEDLDRHLPAQARPQDVALMTGAELWALPDDALRAILAGPWRCCAYYALRTFVPEHEVAIEARFGEELLIDISAALLVQRGYDGEVFKKLPRRARVEFLEKINQDNSAAETVKH